LESVKLRILVLADSRSFHTERYVRELRRQGCHILLASLERGSTYHFRLKSRGPVSSLHYALASFEIRRLIRRFRPDVVNPHFVSGYGFISVLAGARRRAPVFVNLWGSDVLVVPQKSTLHRWKVALGLARADFVAGDSAFLLDTARSVSAFSCPSAVIPWGVESEFLSLHKRDYRFHTPLRILVPRPHERVYGNTLIVRALAPLIEDDKVRVTFPGFGTLFERFRHESRAVVGDRLHFYDVLPRAGFLAMMADHDIYLSNARSDSSPASLIEAMALGLVPVVADVPGVHEWLTDQNGFLFEPFVGDTLKKTILHLIDTQEDFRAMRRRNFERVKANAVFEDNVARTISIMRELAARRKK